MNLLVIILFFAVSACARADTWPAPEVRIITSPDRSALVRVQPADRQGQYASAIVMRFDMNSREFRKLAEFPLRNRTAPHDVVITDGGSFLVTFDDWGQLGRTENVIVIYRGTGELVRAWTLEELFSKTELATFVHSVSSTWWRGAVRVLDRGSADPTVEIKTARASDEVSPIFKGRTPSYPFYLEVRTGIFHK